MTKQQTLDSPHCLVGTVDQIGEVVKQRREEYGIPYLSIFEEDIEEFAPVVARLAGS